MPSRAFISSPLYCRTPASTAFSFVRVVVLPAQVHRYFSLLFFSLKEKDKKQDITGGNKK